MEIINIKEPGVWRSFKKYLLDELGFVQCIKSKKYNLGYIHQPVLGINVGAEQLSNSHIVVTAEGSKELIKGLYNCYTENCS